MHMEGRLAVFIGSVQLRPWPRVRNLHHSKNMVHGANLSDSSLPPPISLYPPSHVLALPLPTPLPSTSLSMPSLPPASPPFPSLFKVRAFYLPESSATCWQWRSPTQSNTTHYTSRLSTAKRSWTRLKSMAKAVCSTHMLGCHQRPAPRGSLLARA